MIPTFRLSSRLLVCAVLLAASASVLMGQQNVTIPVSGGGTLTYSVQANSGTCYNGSPVTYQYWNYSAFSYTDPSGVSQSLSGSATYFQSPGGSSCPPNGAQPNPLVLNANAGVIDFYASSGGGGSATITPAPSISDISPFGGSVGSSVTVTGGNFGSSQGTSTVSFGSKLATATAWSSSSISATVPNGALTGNISVAVSGATASSPCPFTVTPTMNAVSPQAAVTGSQVTISGDYSSLVASGITPGVYIGGAFASIVSMNQTTIVAIVPPSAVSGNIQLKINYDHWGQGCPNSGAVLVIVTGPAFTVIHQNLDIGSIPGQGGTFEIRDDAGNLVRTGNLSTPRSMHSATLLQNGTVFVAGGTSDTTSWQILDQNGNVLSSGLLQDSRMSHVAALLLNGNVFVAGGAGAPGTWEIHTPTGALVASGTLQGNRGSGAQGATLQNGNVWISSGSAPTGIGGTDCTYEIYGPAGNLVTSGSMLNCFPGGTIQVLQNGNIMLLGGDGAPGTYEIRSQTGAFVSSGSLTSAFNHGANSVLLNNGNVFIFGSCQAGAHYPDYRDPTQVNTNPNDLTFSCGTLGATSTWEIRDQNGNFVGTNSLLNQYDGAGAVVLSNGNVLITGGNLCGGCWEIRSPAGAMVSQGSLFDSRGGGHTLTHF